MSARGERRPRAAALLRLPARGPEPPEEVSQRGLCPGQTRGLGESPLLPCSPEKHPEPPCASPGSHSQEQPGVLSTLSRSHEGVPAT